MIKYLDQINIEGKRILIRTDFNVPIRNNLVDSDFRIISMKVADSLLEKRNPNRDPGPGYLIFRGL